MGIKNFLQKQAAAEPAATILAANTAPDTALANALFTTTQQRLYALLFGQPQRSFYATELIKLAGIGTGAVQRELKKLEAAGLVTISRVGTQKHYQANAAAPAFNELCGLVRKTLDLFHPLRHALEPRSQAIDVAVVYGVDGGTEANSAGDLGVLLVADKLTANDVARILAPAAQALGRKLKPLLLNRKDFHRRVKEGNAFLTLVLAGETKVLLGRLPADLTATAPPTGT